MKVVEESPRVGRHEVRRPPECDAVRQRDRLQRVRSEDVDVGESLVDHPVVVIGRVGQKCGAVRLTDGPAWVTDNALYNESLSEQVTTEFLALITASAQLNDIRNRNDLPLVTQQIVHGVRVGLPPLPEQRAIAATLDSVDAAIERAREERAALQSSKASTADALLTGRVRVPIERANA